MQGDPGCEPRLKFDASGKRSVNQGIWSNNGMYSPNIIKKTLSTSR